MKAALGTYRYSLDGVVQAIDEPFRLAPADDGFVLSGQRIVGKQVMLEVEARYRGDACIEMAVAWNMDDRRSFQYRHADTELEWREGSDPIQKLALPEGCLLFPLLRAGTGFLLPQLNNRSLGVVTPNLRQPNGEDFLTPLLSTRHSRRDVQDPGRYRYFGGEYGDTGADYWINDDGLVERYVWDSPQGRWEIRLED